MGYPYVSAFCGNGSICLSENGLGGAQFLAFFFVGGNFGKEISGISVATGFEPDKSVIRTPVATADRPACGLPDRPG
jgi:hypothetical protein